MRKFGILITLTVMSVSIALSSCQKKNDPASENFDVDRYFSNLKTEKFITKKGKVLDIDAIISALPNGWVVEYSSSNFDAPSGATILTNATFTTAKNSKIGISAKELLVWGSDSVAIMERLQGNRADQEPLPMATRIEATDIKLFGLETLMKPIIDSTNALINGIAKNDPEISGLDLTLSMDRYEFTIGKLILTDFVLHPSMLELTKFPANLNQNDSGLSNEEVMAIWHWFQKIGNFYSMVSLDNLAMYDGVFDLTMTQYGQPTQMSGRIELIGYKTINRGDINYSLTKNMSYDMKMPVPPTDKDENASRQSFEMHNSIGQSLNKNIRLAKAMSHIARGVMPPRTDTDFISLGAWKIENSITKFNGTKLYSIDSMTFDLSEFHWLVPEVISFHIDNMKFNIASYADYMKTSLETFSPSDTEALAIYDGLSEIMEKVTNILKKYNMEEPSVDLNMSVRWDGNTGQSAIAYGYGIDDFMHFRTQVEGILPNYDAIMDIIIDNLDELDDAAVEALFLRTLKLKSHTMSIKDEGGLDKIFAMAKDFAELAPEDNAGARFLRLNSPEQLRETAAASLMLGAGPAQKEFPPAIDYLQSASNFIREGGELTFSTIPPYPLGIDEMQSITAPDEIVQKFGISIVHKP